LPFVESTNGPLVILEEEIDSMATPQIDQGYPATPLDFGNFEDKATTFSRCSRERRLRQVRFVVTDLMAVWFSASVALYLRFSVKGSGLWDYANSATIGGHIGVLLLYSGLIVLFCNTQRLYCGVLAKSAGEESWDIGKAVALATALQLICIYLSGLKFVSRFVIVFTMVVSFLALMAWRRIRGRRLQTSLASDCRNVLIVGQGDQAQALHDELQENPQFGYAVKGILGSFEGQRHHREADKVLGSIDKLHAVVRGHFIDDIFVCDPDREIVKRVAYEAQRCGLGVHIIPDLYDGLAWGAPVEYLGRFPTLYLPHRPKPVIQLMLKRWLDSVCSIMALLIASPLLLLIGAAIKLDSRGPVIYASTRIGRKGRTFRCYKFRTMSANAEALKASLQHLNERDSVLFKITNDPRITRLGRILRKYSLDELPQFWNVLKGDMSMVGPRPPLADEVQQYELEYLRRLDVLPGITGLWQVESRCNPSFASYISLDVQYVERWHLLLDLTILLKTVAVVVAGSGQ
jgi:exopolysaccharide biosynthesis polyprenyl glycosylphosphotransferase